MYKEVFIQAKNGLIKFDLVEKDGAAEIYITEDNAQEFIVNLYAHSRISQLMFGELSSRLRIIRSKGVIDEVVLLREMLKQAELQTKMDAQRIAQLEEKLGMVRSDIKDETAYVKQFGGVSPFTISDVGKWKEWRKP